MNAKRQEVCNLLQKLGFIRKNNKHTIGFSDEAILDHAVVQFKMTYYGINQSPRMDERFFDTLEHLCKVYEIGKFAKVYPR